MKRYSLRTLSAVLAILLFTSTFTAVQSADVSARVVDVIPTVYPTPEDEIDE